MRKFKHKKTGAIASCTNTMSPYYAINTNFDVIPKRYVEDSLDWEEIKEKEYEILSFVDLDRIYPKLPNGKFKGYSGDYTEAQLHAMRIQSVKRLSDGEVFSLGEIINVAGKNRTLDKIFIMNGTSLFYCFTDNKKDCWSMDNIQKVKQPLFTTEDGVDIEHEGKPWYVVYTQEVENNHEINRSGIPLWTVADSLGLYSPQFKGIKRFSTKEKAEEFCLLNKPCLSIEDVIEFFYTDFGYLIYPGRLNKTVIEHLKALVCKKSQ